ncbi:hypothetical protein [Haloprofundus salinisoli]|uniref:hypothetical protein n=1 Tax=Haloprofundus salinisoli TaxID=2876193 RepID=UPI001CC98E9E|nr:hypothetical protein [Haloprofundus salinisoli]
MEKEDVNRRITAEVDKIGDGDLREFIQEALAFERSKMDRDQPHFKSTYRKLLKQYAPNPEEGDSK